MKMIQVLTIEALDYGHPDRIEIFIKKDFVPTDFKEYISDDFGENVSLNIPKNLANLFYGNVLLLAGYGGYYVEIVNKK
jgi:hypothetical protein